ncbi:MAG: Homoserine dehydrogenase [Firmicutes bacterium ADurb.Bin080]|jgi:homoserine dehydrogenase|nr:homoserine dehydrogenase [Clostridiales bacterium]OQC15622.1 MAG: Homoserine dehydrogenase [Firmicutes bacterium ADurb.Bin080]
MKKVGVALLGLGTVGGGTYRILSEMREKIKSTDDVDIEIIHVLERNQDRVRELGVDPKIVSTDINNVLKDPRISIVAEFFGGIEPARSFLIQSLKAGKSIVTANKEMFSKHWSEFECAAKEGNAGIYFEATCAGGVPIIRTLTASMQGNTIQSIQGIVNGTTNYILTKMADEGKDYDSVLKEAQKLGYAEANPSADVDGFDSMYKLSILSTLCFNKKVPLNKIYREGITGIDKIDIENGKKFGYTLKLLAIGKLNDGKIEARVHPAFIANENPLASVKGSFNAILINGDNVGDIMLYGRGAGDLPTGSAIVSDIVYCARQQTHKLSSFDNRPEAVSDEDFENDFECEYYVRMNVMDKPGVLAKIAAAFGKYDVSINSVEQIASQGSANIIFMIHMTQESFINKAIKDIKSLSEVLAVNSIIRVI